MVQVAEFVDHGVWVCCPFVIGDAIDLPADPSGIAVSDLVVLHFASAAMPGDVVDLDAPSGIRVGAIEVDD